MTPSSAAFKSGSTSRCPTPTARKSILEIQLLKEGHTLDYPLQEVVRSTEWFSGRDLERLSNQAINVMVEELNGQIPKCVDAGREAIEGYKLRIRPLQKKDFDEAFKRIRVDTEKMKKLVTRFHEFAESN